MKTQTLGITNNRLKHMIGVAKYMAEHAEEYGVAPDEAFVVGLLHDIGYLYGDPYTHEEKGADLLEQLGFIYSDVVRAHGLIPSKVKDKIGVDTEPMLELLFNADLSVDVTDKEAGKEVGFDRRIENIGKRHGFDSEQYSNCKLLKEQLEELRKAAE